MCLLLALFGNSFLILIYPSTTFGDTRGERALFDVVSTWCYIISRNFNDPSCQKVRCIR